MDLVLFFLFFNSCFIYVSNRKYLLSTLLSLELIVVILFLVIFSSLNKNLSESYFLMIFIVFSVCEGALGLSILVSMIRTHGNNFFQSFNTLLC